MFVECSIDYNWTDGKNVHTPISAVLLCAVTYRKFQTAVLQWKCENKVASQFIFESLFKNRYYDNAVTLRYLKPRVA